MKTKSSRFLILSIVLVILSIIAAIFLFSILKQRQESLSQSVVADKIDLIPTDTPPLIDDLGDDDLFDSPTSTPTPSPSPKPTKIPSPTSTPTPTPTSVSTTKSFTDSQGLCSLTYSSSRILYQDTTGSAKRYTFYLPTSSFALHVADSYTWSWTHPNRQFTSTFTIDGNPTFRYDIDDQTIVDIQGDNNNFTLQCIHNGDDDLKDECEQFLQSFKLL